MSDTFHIKKAKIAQVSFFVITTLITAFTAIWMFSSEVSAIKNDIFNLQKNLKDIPSINEHISNDRVMFTEIKTTLKYIRGDISDIKRKIYNRGK